MFNVCPHCGMYEVEREVTAEADTGFAITVCGSCGGAIRFRRQPLFVVTGASGAGKSSTCHELAHRQTGFLILESDILWGAIDVSGESGTERSWNAWLRVVKNIHQGSQPVILSGTLVPETLERQPERRYIGDIHYLALVVDPGEQGRRLRARPAWRESFKPEFIEEHLRFNQWLVDHATSGTPRWTVTDTTGQTVTETADSVLQWVASCQDRSAARTSSSLS